MAQVFNELRRDNVRGAIYEDVEQKFDTLRSNFSGEIFPENPFVGQFCFRTDESKMYHWNGEEWKEVGSGGIDLNTGDRIYDWIGTKAEYEEQQIETLHPEYLCFITDDETPSVCATRSLDNLDESGEAKLKSIIKLVTELPEEQESGVLYCIAEG